jgi:type IV pilus assembly protein PilF
VRARKLAPANPDLANNYGSFLCQMGPRQGSHAAV